VGIIGVTSETVVKSIRNAYAIKDNIADDFQFVDDKYIAKYKIRPRSIARTQAIAGRLEDMEPSVRLNSTIFQSHIQPIVLLQMSTRVRYLQNQPSKILAS
jgi:hypothetical protein